MTVNGPDGVAMNEYPRTNDQGVTVWACCESSIGPLCGHRENPDTVLSDIRNMAANVLTNHMTTDQMVSELRNLVFLFQKLDRWLSSGADLPDDWMRSR